MGFKIKNSLTGEFEKLPILTLKGEKGETGGVEEYNKVDYMGNKYETLKQANDANVEYAVKTAIGEFNYLDYEGQNITATDSIEGRSKSAILKGQTLVNVASLYQQHYTYSDYNLSFIDKTKTYFIKFNTTFETTQIGFIVDNNTWNINIQFEATTNGYVKIKPNETKEVNRLRIRFNGNTDNNFIPTANIVCIEYQEGMENWDIPYFEGMQSVKMPVLTTTGKNLMDINSRDVNSITYHGVTYSIDANGYYSIKGTLTSGGRWVNTFDLTKSDTWGNSLIITEDFMLKKGTYTLSAYDISGETSTPFRFIRLYKKPFTTIAELHNRTSTTFTLNEDTKLSMMFQTVNYNSGDFIDVKFKVQIEKGTQATSYEPYKSNILSTSEDVTLRGIEDIKDELNCLTGEVTERIGEIVLDGSEDWILGSGFSSNENGNFECKNINVGNRYKKVVSTHFNYDSGTDDRERVRATNSNYIVIYINKARLESPTVDGFKNWLITQKNSGNPVKVQYQLLEKSIKTVDLSDNHVYSYKDVTHYDCSSAEGSLVPTLSVKVPTDVQATIAQQRETIQTLNSENERLNQIQEALKASMLNSQVQLMNLSWDTDFEVFTLRESIAPKDFLLDSRTGSNIDKFSQAKFIIENDCPDLEKLNSQIEYYFSKDVFSQEQFEELTDLISIVKGGNGCEY